MDRYIQIATLFSVVVGMALVIWELQQVRTLSRAQLSSDYVTTMNAVNQSVSGEGLSAALETACQNPSELSLKETIELDNYYFSVVNLVARMYLLSERDQLYPQDYWKAQIGFLTPVFASEYGRIWFKERSNFNYDQELLDAGLQFMQTIEPNSCLSQYRRRVLNDA